VTVTLPPPTILSSTRRVAQSIESLLQLDLDPATTGRSTAPYGVAHILAAVTVTNNELRAKALAEKDMSVEQYKQLQELQRVKAKDAEGNEFEEKKVLFLLASAHSPTRTTKTPTLRPCAASGFREFVPWVAFQRS
jgi:type II secretory pathway component HofQ